MYSNVDATQTRLSCEIDTSFDGTTHRVTQCAIVDKNNVLHKQCQCQRHAFRGIPNNV